MILYKKQIRIRKCDPNVQGTHPDLGEIVANWHDDSTNFFDDPILVKKRLGDHYIVDIKFLSVLNHEIADYIKDALDERIEEGCIQGRLVYEI